MDASHANLVPTTDILFQECPRARVLVLGKSGAGKSALINAVFGTDLTKVSARSAGVHDIDREFISSSNERIVVHDSEGFEIGDEAKLQRVLQFIRERSQRTVLRDRLHAIWVCTEIPHANSRLFEAGVEKVLKVCREEYLPVIVVFTKLDILDTRVRIEIASQVGISSENFESTVQAKVKQLVEELCVVPLRELTGYEHAWVSVSTRRKFKYTMKELVALALEKTELESVWISLAIAQRSQAEESLKASVMVGKRKWWNAVFSSVLLGEPIDKIIGVLHLDIVRVWNTNDPDKHLESPTFMALTSVLVEDLYERTNIDFSLTKAAVEGLLANPMLIPVTGPMLVVTCATEWVRGTYKKTKSSLRCLAGFIIDLSLTLDILFYLTRGGQPVTVRLTNMALKSYQSRKARVHNRIRSWMDQLDSKFDHLNPGLVIKKLVEIMDEHCIKPEQGSRMRAGTNETDEDWILVDDLRGLGNGRSS